MQREVSHPSSPVRFEPLMLSIPQPPETRTARRVDPDNDPVTWSDRMRKIDELEEPERWDGMS